MIHRPKRVDWNAILFVVIVLQFVLISCTKRYYYNYFSRRVKEVTLKYDPKAKVSTRWAEPEATDKPSRKKINEVIAIIERRNALTPDSAFATVKLDLSSSQNGMVSADVQKKDSFYFRIEKIAYIKKQGLVTPGKHFISRQKWNE